MAKKLIILVAIAALLIPAMGWSLDAPHTNIPGYGIDCGSCHWTNSSATPPWENAQVPDAPDNTINNRRCYACHDGNKPLTPAAKTHSTSTTSNTYWTTQGGWKTECVTCHNPHQQRQTRVWGSASYVTQGTAPQSVVVDTVNNVSTITLPASLGPNYFGYYILPDIRYPFYYEITNDTTNTAAVTVKGQVNKTYVGTGGYAIVYARNVKESITYINPANQPVGGSVKLFGPSGVNGPADPVATGVCYVCHTQTNHYSSKTGADSTHHAGEVCTSCHAHLQGFKPACDGCHGNPPTVSSQTPPNGLVWVTLQGGSGTGTGSTTAGAHGTHVNSKSISCDACHLNSVGTGATHNAGSVTLGFKGFGGSSGGGAYNGQSGVTYNATVTTPATSASSGGLKQCSNVYCHGATMATNNGTNRAPTWDNAATGACGTCHGADSANPPQLGSHDRHTSASTGYSFTCTLCHNNAAGTHVNGKVEWAFNTADTRTNGGKYNSAASGSTNAPAPSGTYQSCSNLYCHSSGEAAPSTYATPAWGNASTGACGTCHGTVAAAPPASVPHTKHVGTAAAYQFSCSKCHNTTVTATADSTVQPSIADKTLHVNGNRDVSFDAFNSGGSYNGTNCSNIYCHSQGTGGTGQTGDTRPIAAPATAPTWTTGSINCGSCHGGDSTGRPAYVSGTPKANSHMLTTHSQKTCDLCHNQTTTTGNTITNPAKHVNKTYDITTSFNYSYAADGGTCSTTYCHGSSTIKWGASGTLTCDSCHSGQGAGTAVTKGYTTAHSTKHTQSYLLACENCHTQLNSNTANRISHAGGDVNPSTPQTAEVKFTDQSGSTQYGGGGSTFRYSNLYANPYGVVAPTPVYTPGLTSAGSDPKNALITWTAGSCSNVWCHSNANPAGGTNSYSSPAWNSVIDCGSCHRKPDTAANMAAAGTPEKMSVSHVKHIATDQYGQNTNFTCNTCHSNTASDSSTISNTANHVNGAKDVALNAWAGGSFATNQCSNVYCHSQGTSATAPFTPNVAPTWGGSLDPNATGTNCEGCHGAKYGGGYVNTMNTNAHGAHINTVDINKRGYQIGCSVCHSATMSGTGMSIGNYANHVNKQVNVKFDNAGINKDADLPTYNGASTTGANGSTKASGSVVGSCANVYCHSTGNVNNAGVAVAPTTFRTIAWNGAAIGCDGCHGDQAGRAHPTYTTGAAGSNTANSHVKHVESSSFSCDFCHNTTTTDTTIPPTAVVVGGTHLNRTDDISFKLNAGKTGTYNATAKTCSATYCHGTGASPQWGGATTCTSCHDASGQTTTLSTRHDKHYNTATAATVLAGGTDSHTATGYVFACLNCHPTDQHATGPASGVEDAAIGGTKQLAVNYTPAVTNLTDGKGFKYTNYGTCSTVCHTKDGATLGSAVMGNPTWNSSNAVGCGFCHNKAGDATPAWSAPHTKHINTYSVAGNPIISCNSCHSGTASDNATINGITGRNQHPNGTKDVAFNATVGGSWSGTQCSNTYCHSNGTSFTAPTQTAMSWSGNITACNVCHGDISRTDGMPGYTTGKANSHVAHVQNNSYTCNNCHNDTTTTGNTITNYANHVNKAYNLQAGGAGISFTPTVGNPTTPSSCSNISCHGGNTATWGATLSCQDCHLGAGDTDDYTYGNGTTAKIDSTEWTTKGHGQAAIALTCDLCHDNTVGHGVSTNPFRLANIGTALNYNCLACHATGSLGYKGKNSTVKVDKYHAGAGHDLTRNGGQYCWDCHDPHGDANIKMVQAKPARKSNAYGVPTELPINPVVFTNNTIGAGAGGFAMTSGTFENGVCNTCHTAANTPHYNSTGVDGTHYTAVCTSCHNHSKDTTYDGNAFQGAGDCNACHDYDVRGATYVGGVWTGGTWGLNNQDAPVNQGWGAHAKHINHLKTRLAIATLLDPVSQTYGVGTPANVCGVCHSNTGADHGSGGRNINFNGSATYQFGPNPPTYNGVSGTSSSVNPKSCSNISCHFTTTPVWSAY
ncbi:MAG: CxxxxCH/CxxCH domain-containing protein [Nitrospiraceae bacterium]|nr:CxxxxCH/CxxCH domain-containing protein [Nitrospiraceae bacterium]